MINSCLRSLILHVSSEPFETDMVHLLTTLEALVTLGPDAPFLLSYPTEMPE